MKRTKRALWGILIAAALAFYGCGGGGEDSTVGGDAGAAVEKGSVTFQVKFPDNGEVGKALVDVDAETVTIEWGQYDEFGYFMYGGDASLARGATGFAEETVQIAAGRTVIRARAADSLGNILEEIQTEGKIAANRNNPVLLTFLTGEWTFVDESGTPTPLALAGGESLGGFHLNADYCGDGEYDGGNCYLFTWFDSDLQTFVTSDMDQHMMFDGESQTNWSILDGGDYNLTQNNLDFDTASSGDRLLIIGGQDPFDEGMDTFTPDISPYLDATVIDGKTISGHVFELTFDSVTATPVTDPAAVCPDDAYRDTTTSTAMASRAAALEETSGKVQKATGTSIGPLTVEYTDCREEEVDGDGDNDFRNDDWSDSNNDGVCDTGTEMIADLDNDGVCDYTVFVLTAENIVENFSDAIPHPFTATGSQSVFTPETGTTIIVQ